MNDNTRVRRRSLVRTLGVTALTVGLAGCTGGESDESETDGGAEDFTDASEVTVDVGAGSGGLAFEPAEIEISTGTTVIWEWTGDGGGHNVVATDSEAFASHDSPNTTAEEGYTFEHTFEETGSYPYECTVHAGMEGTVEVVD